MRLIPIILIAACLFSSPVTSTGTEPEADLAARCADRAAIERVYHAHRTGTKQTFEEAMPRALLEQVIRQDQHREAVLRKAYGVEIREKHYFEDLDPELQKVLRVQLQKPGDVSAVIETPGGFLIFLAKSKNAETLTAASVSIPKRSCEEWLAQQPAAKP